jgi:hypothetical protein
MLKSHVHGSDLLAPLADAAQQLPKEKPEMPSLLWLRLRSFVLAFVVLTIVATAGSTAWAQLHVVSSAEFHQEILKTAQARAKNLETLTNFLSTPPATNALHAAHMDPAKVKSAVDGLSDGELQSLAARAAKSQLDFAAGDLSDRDLLLIIVGIAALILIIVAVR